MSAIQNLFQIRHPISSVDIAKNFLVQKAVDHLDGWHRYMAFHVLNDPYFWVAPGAANKHHAYLGGLAVHTAQVVFTSFAMVSGVKDIRVSDLILAGIWHDYAKLFDYVQTHEGFNSTTHRHLIGHLSKSYALFHQLGMELVSDSDDDNYRRYNSHISPTVDEIDFIGHLILASHGRKEWGSPVEPICFEAWALHSADMASCQFCGGQIHPDNDFQEQS